MAQVLLNMIQGQNRKGRPSLMILDGSMASDQKLATEIQLSVSFVERK